MVATFSPFQRKCVSDAVDEIIEALCVAAHEIASPHPAVTRLQHVTEHLALGLVIVRVALEPVLAARGQPGQQFARSSKPHGNAAAIGVAQRQAGLDIVPHDQSGDRAAMKFGTRPTAPTLPSTL